jgi:hypothetical protein
MITTSRRMLAFVGHMAGIGEVHTKILYGNAKERDHYEDLVIDGKN